MPGDRILFSFVLAVAFVSAALLNLSEAYGQYSVYRDARGLRGFVAAITMLAGVVALVTGTSVFREAWPGVAGVLRIVSAASVGIFLIGVLFSVVSWRMGR